MIGSSLIIKPHVYCVTDFEGGVKVCGDAVLRYFFARFCGNFYFSLRYFGFTRLRGSRSQESLGNGYR